MTPKFTEKEWLKDFGDFVSQGTETSAPEELNKSIVGRVQRALNPSPLLVFTKLLGIHTSVSILSLAICDQFGVTTFNTGFSLASYFMKFGHTTCLVLCGFLFISLSVMAACIFLKPEEIKVFYKNSLFQASGLSLLSLLVFAILGAEIFLGISFFWLAGALLGGILPLYMFTKLKYKTI